MAAILELLKGNLPLILGVLLGISEALSLIPVIKSNGIIQSIIGVLKFLKEKLLPPAA